MAKPTLIDLDPWLQPYKADIDRRLENYKTLKKNLLGAKKSFSDFANGHLYFGFHKEKSGWVYREWAPGARQLYLIGDFNNWDRTAHPLTKKADGCWEIHLKDKKFGHGACVKVRVVSVSGAEDRIPLYIRRAVQDEQTKDFCGQVWDKKFVWTDEKFKPQNPLFIYEAHPGMAQEKEGIGSYREFADNILPRIRKAGYTAVQLMAVQEHPYYGSFGYQVSNFFAPSSRFGTPEDLKYLINKAHGLGLAVFLDLVHSHAVKNRAEGINGFDGTDYQFFHAGSQGTHPAWDSKLFNYGKPEVLHFLLSNIKYWLTEFHFDGLRFDGVTSMLYRDHGLGTAFDNYAKYFSSNTDTAAVVYLQFANALAHEINPRAVTIAEDMSGMPGMCIPIEQGGLGFAYRLAMGSPDFWVKTLREKSDEDWNLWDMWNVLTGRRPQEKVIGYCESHDQALVGDKTIAFWLMDKEMYWHMLKTDANLIIARGIALHKLIRFVTLALSGEGYLNFLGNEFGHPEWIDFPREGNNWSCQYARRQWSLADNPELQYEYLARFDRDMLAFAAKTKLPAASDLKQLWVDQEKKILVFQKAGLIFAFNFHPQESQKDFVIPVQTGKYKVIFDSDQKIYGGQARIDRKVIYKAGQTGFAVYLPCRTALVLQRILRAPG
ncbi:1,4-alpha-glucan branching enzyme [Candidatus Termititenax spirochaetophilus]|uniref:1,4-alpha-glucan branching enzyme n=1 Tax=Candidatus Termititenax spirochaetophilus TaxID=2218522 RepID=A0A388T830_9BACT|nr:1,4-alpha-glucan branching enzyme [Candidatus Termititenax spirochaetophilus]